MIISHEHQFTFVHIPKCAGSYIRNKLKQYDDTKGAFSNGLKHYEGFGFLNDYHIPLFLLKEYFPATYSNLSAYWSFAVLRNPYTRFSSALSQYLLEHGEKEIHEMTTKEIQVKIEGVIQYLEKNSLPQSFLSSKYIHFQRQVDYVYVGEEQIIDSLFFVDDMESLQKQFYEHTRHHIVLSQNDKKVNETIVVRNNFLRQLLNSIRPLSLLLTKHLSESIKDKIRDLVYVPRDKRFKALFESRHVKDFIKRYYQDDFELITSRLSKDAFNI